MFGQRSVAKGSRKPASPHCCRKAGGMVARATSIVGLISPRSADFQSHLFDKFLNYSENLQQLSDDTEREK
jgi:hypothetical protein